MGVDTEAAREKGLTTTHDGQEYVSAARATLLEFSDTQACTSAVGYLPVDVVAATGAGQTPARSASDAMSGTTRSGVTAAGGVAPLPGRSWRRLTHADERPSGFARTWSWNRLLGHVGIRSRGAPIRSNASSKLWWLGLYEPACAP